MATTTLTRDSYGALWSLQTTAEADRNKFLKALKVVAKAAKAGKIAEEFDDMKWGRSGREKGHKIGSAIRHEIYDFSPKQVLVCVRYVDGTKYGQSITSKEYFVISKVGRDVAVEPANKAVAAKVAGQKLGEALKLLNGK